MHTPGNGRCKGPEEDRPRLYNKASVVGGRWREDEGRAGSKSS